MRRRITASALPDRPSKKEVADFFGVSLGTVNNWMKSGKLKAHKIDGTVFFHKEEIIAI